MTFTLKDENWETLIKGLQNFDMADIKHYYLNSVPDDSDEVRNFMRNSVQNPSQFWFNWSKQDNIEGGNYVEELKAIASKTLDHFSVKFTNLSAKDFCGIVSAAKKCRNLYFNYNILTLDSELDFGEEMKGCEISKIDFSNLEYSKCYGFIRTIHRKFYSKLLTAISKCDPLAKSLNKLNIFWMQYDRLTLIEAISNLDAEEFS